MASRTITVNRAAVMVGGAVALGVLAFVWYRARKARQAAAQQTQQPTVSATAPAPVPGYGTNMAGVVDVVQGPPGTTTRVTNLRTGERVV